MDSEGHSEDKEVKEMNQCSIHHPCAGIGGNGVDIDFLSKDLVAIRE